MPTVLDSADRKVQGKPDSSGRVIALYFGKLPLNHSLSAVILCVQSIMVYLSRFEQQVSQSEPSLSTWESRLNKGFSYSRSRTVVLSGGIWQCQETVRFSQLGEAGGAAGMSSKHPTMLRTQPPTAKMVPVLPVPNVKYVLAAVEIVTDKHRDGEPCFWHVEEAGVP